MTSDDFRERLKTRVQIQLLDKTHLKSHIELPFRLLG